MEITKKMLFLITKTSNCFKIFVQKLVGDTSMKRALTKNHILNSYFFLFIFILICDFISAIKSGYPKEGWNITEFLINYEGGFVRRGLLGEIILYIHNFTGINPYYTIMLISISAYLSLVWFNVKLFIKNGYTLFILPFAFFLGNPIVNNFIIRKDALLILIFILTIYFSLKKNKWYLILVNVSFILGLLIHEGIGFFCFPILFWILNYKNSNQSKFSCYETSLISFFQVLPSAIVFLCVCYFKGSDETAYHIWNSWGPIDFPIQAKDNTSIPAAIDAISWSLKKGLSLSIHTLKNFNGDIYAPIAWGLIISTIYYILTNTSKLNFKLLNYKPTRTFNRVNISNILVLQFLAVIPLFVLGWDYSRWIFYWVVSSFAIILLVPEEELTNLFPKSILVISSKFNYILDFLLSKSFVFLFCLLIGFSDYSWRFFHTTQSNSFVMMLKFISEIMHHLLLKVKDIT